MKELDNPGEIFSVKNYSFDFPNVEMQYESYVGLNVVLRYDLQFYNVLLELKFLYDS